MTTAGHCNEIAVFNYKVRYQVLDKTELNLGH